VDGAADAVVSADWEGVEVADGCWYRLEGCRLFEGSVRAVLVVMSLVVAEDPQQMSLVPDQRVVEQFSAAATDPTLRVRVRAGGLDGTLQDPDAGRR
jgi:hypothetical protein